MINLAGVENCDRTIHEELFSADIKWKNCPTSNGEVPFNIMGYLNAFTFERAWYYYEVKGFVPLDVAEYIWLFDVKKDIRVAGHYAAPHPRNWAIPRRYIIDNLNLEDTTWGAITEMCNSGAINAPRFVDCYHIDSQEGLNFFAKIIMKRNVSGE
jgi:hypothetical protein